MADRTLSRIENGHGDPGLGTLTLIADGLEMPLWRLVKFIDDEPKSTEKRFELIAKLFANITSFDERELQRLIEQAALNQKFR